MLKNYKDVLHEIEKAPATVQDYFSELPSLIEDGYDWPVCISYAFSRVEKAQNMALYCGMLKRYGVQAKIAYLAIETEIITRPVFRKMFANIFDRPIPDDIVNLIKEAEGIRDQIMHGKGETVSAADQRKSLVDIIRYAERMNDYCRAIAGFRPFGNLRGFKGRRSSLPEDTSRLVARGLGFKLS